MYLCLLSPIPQIYNDLFVLFCCCFKSLALEGNTVCIFGSAGGAHVSWLMGGEGKDGTPTPPHTHQASICLISSCLEPPCIVHILSS